MSEHNYLHKPVYTIVTEPFEEEFLVSAVLRNNELTGSVKSGARYKELLSGEMIRLKYDTQETFGGMFDQKNFYNHTLHPIGVLFDRVRYKGMNFIPRGNLRICVQCVIDDEKKLGTAYIHRTHVTPGTLVCHVHAVELLEVCPVCHVEIKRHMINSLSSCISRKNIIQSNTSPNTATYHYSKFIYEILKKKDLEKYRQYSIPTMDNSLEKIGYDLSSKTKYMQAREEADQKIGTGLGMYQRALKSNNSTSQSPMHLFPREGLKYPPIFEALAA